MAYTNGKSQAMKWVVLGVSSFLLVVSTLIRTMQGQEADDGLCWVFISVGGLIFGAKIVEYFKK
jgi:hypothetical protein